MIELCKQSVKRIPLWNTKADFSSADFLKQIELCGRKCYKSESKITEDSAYPFVLNVCKRGHWSVTEFGTIDFIYESILDYAKFPFPYTQVFLVNDATYISTSLRELMRALYHTCDRRYQMLLETVVGVNIRDSEELLDKLLQRIDSERIRFRCTNMDVRVKHPPLDIVGNERVLLDITTSRTVSHELVRHRALSFLQESQRYCRYKGKGVFIDPRDSYGEIDDDTYNSLLKHFEDSMRLYTSLLKNNSPQFSRQVLPNQTKTELVVLGYKDYFMNWFMEQRDSDRAEPSMHRLAHLIREAIEDEN